MLSFFLVREKKGNYRLNISETIFNGLVKYKNFITFLSLLKFEKLLIYFFLYELFRIYLFIFFLLFNYLLTNDNYFRTPKF